ncbi:MAG: hypothetical protein EPN91_02230 [Salinibacterium sp.]|nr:MAG: hypothetical protein EPN91_02230 [Salinibacterium sp.]
MTTPPHPRSPRPRPAYVPAEDARLIAKIVLRAKAMAEAVVPPTDNIPQYDSVALTYILTSYHTSPNCPQLNLERLLRADDFDFTHDVFGIKIHFDRTTNALLNNFLPRCAR